MRTAFIDQLIIEADKNDKIHLLVGDLGYSVVEPFQEKYPERFINIGVAEQNMAGIAAGLALEGNIVFIYSIGNFPTLRCLEQIRYDICYHNLNVKIIAVGGGFSYGPLGASHHATEELGILRAIPNLTVCAPGDPQETQALITLAAGFYGPCYIRLGKSGEPVVHPTGLSFGVGEILKIMEGENVAVLTTGSMLKYAYEFIRTNNLNVSLYSFPFVKPLNKGQLKKIVLGYRKLITLEEHQASCGFGSAILEAISDLTYEDPLIRFPQIKRIAIPDKFFSIAGTQDYLRKLANLELGLSDFKFTLFQG